MKKAIHFKRYALVAISSLCLFKGLFGQSKPEDSFTWVDAKDLVVEGRGFADKSEHFYDRLPTEAKNRVRKEVWKLGQDSSGMVVPFETNSRTIYARWKVRDNGLAMPHMPATGVSGLDLYMRDGNQWRWAGAGRPTRGQSFSARLVSGLPKRNHEFLLYLPLYNGTDSLQIGIEPGSKIKPLVRKEKPVVFYGTSITQGGCASRPGMAYPAILGRRLDIPTINLGFSGNGRMEPEAMVDIANLEEPAVFVIDSLPNMQPTEFNNYEAGIALIRKNHPTVPLVLVSSIEYPSSWVNSGAKRRHENSNKNLREFYQKLSATDPNVYFVEAEGLLGTDGEGTVDGTHPTDLGFVRIADQIEPVLRKALKRE